MIKKIGHNNGYIGLIAILVGVIIIAFLFISQMEILGLNIDKKMITDISTSTTGVVKPDISEPQNIVTPIEKAQNVKNLLENKYKGTIVE